MSAAKTLAPMCYPKWAERGNFVWLVTEDILDENKEVPPRSRVRSTLIGSLINLIRVRVESPALGSVATRLTQDHEGRRGAGYSPPVRLVVFHRTGVADWSSI